MLLAPLAPEAGGYGLCKAEGAEGATAVFATTEDPDYQRILALCEAGKGRLEEIKRFDMPGFEPPEAYVREMKRYGVVASLPASDALNPYALDQTYWRSFHHGPSLSHPAYAAATDTP